MNIIIFACLNARTRARARVRSSFSSCLKYYITLLHTHIHTHIHIYVCFTAERLTLDFESLSELRRPEDPKRQWSDVYFHIPVGPDSSISRTRQDRTYIKAIRPQLIGMCASSQQSPVVDIMLSMILGPSFLIARSNNDHLPTR